ncbi:MAG TPA: hypothetical protein VIL48_02635 [Acidimicrobiales bacterium]
MATDIAGGSQGAVYEGGLREDRSGWSGWIVFAAVMMIIVGALNAIHGLVAVVNDQWVVWTNEGDLYLDLSTWGWVHLVLGIVVVLAGFGLFTGNILARALAVTLAGLSIIANFLYMPAYPVWALTIIAIDAFVIYALTAHGRALA